MSGIEFFWEEADLDGLDEHPLERELQHRLDAVIRYQQLIIEAEAAEHTGAIDHLVRQHEREERAVARIRSALERLADEARARPDQG